MTRCTFMIEPDMLDKLRSIAARTGLSQSEQIREGIRWWLAAREWPLRHEVYAGHPPDDRRRRGGRVVRQAGKTRGK